MQKVLTFDFVESTHARQKKNSFSLFCARLIVPLHHIYLHNELYQDINRRRLDYRTKSVQ
jgi:hypothetical protein